MLINNKLTDNKFKVIFRQMVKFQVEHNLGKLIYDIEYGKLTDQVGKYKEGTEEIMDRRFKDYFILADGQYLIDGLQENGAIKPENVSPYTNIQSLDTYLTKIAKNTIVNNDGAQVYDTINNRIARVGRVDIDVKKLNAEELSEDSMHKLLGQYFFYDNGKHESISTKTAAALRIPQLYPNVHVFLIKRTVRGVLSVVAHIDKDGLNEMMTLNYNNTRGYNGHYVCRAKQIEALYWQFKNENGVVNLESKTNINPREWNIKPIYLNPINSAYRYSYL